MCRTGGRRCPAYSDPEQIAARNARRRAAYAKSKGKKSQKDEGVYGVDKPFNTGNKFLDDLLNDKMEPVEDTKSEKDDDVQKLIEDEEALFGKLPPQKEEVKVPKKKVAVKKAPVKKTTKKKTEPIVNSEEKLKVWTEEEMDKSLKAHLAKKDAEAKLEKSLKKGKTGVENKKSETTVVETTLPAFAFQTPASEGTSKKIFKGDNVELSDDPSRYDSDVKEYGSDSLFKVHDEQDYNSELNLDVKYNSGVLVDRGYFNDKTISGVLDYTKLSETDDRDLGFQELPKDGKLYDISANDKLVNAEDFKRLSKAECDNLTPNQKRGLKYFTSQSYEWVNDALFQKKAKKGKSDDVKGKSFKDIIEGTYVYAGQNVANLKKITSEIDKALQNGPKQQRIVYRGVRNSASFLKDDKGTRIPAADWVKNNLKVGSEIKFDGYQSASPKAVGAGGYTTDKGILYEIVTPEGVNVESITEFSGEYEVTLPRESRYTVASITDNVNVKFGDYNEKHNMTVVRLVAINSKGEVLDGTNSDKPKAITDSYFKELTDVVLK